MIDVNGAVKDYRLFKREKGLINNLRSIIKREYTLKRAVDHVSFHIEGGELVGYVGPNGAGKSTTIKMLSGILMPSSGSILVNGRIPSRERIKNAAEIGVVFGQRSQLYWDLPLRDSFNLHRKLYDISRDRFEQNVERFVNVLEMGSFINQPIRQLSLGQRMRANIAVSLLHDPKVVYLDEPTIGLDIVAKKRIREFIKTVNRENGTTVLLTTHDMNDIEEICERIIIIDKGKIRYDGNLERFKSNFGGSFSIETEFEEDLSGVLNHPLLKISGKQDSGKSFILSGDKNKITIAEAVTWITSRGKIRDIKILESGIEDILIRMYEGEGNHADSGN